MSDLKFGSWQRSAIYKSVTSATLQEGRLVGSLPLTLIDIQTGEQANGQVPFQFVAAKDVAALAPQMIVRTAPPANARDAETTKLVHIDFAAADFPWRYTPRQAVGDRLPPWLVLLVGTADELRLDGNSVAILKSSVLQAHNLADSPRWAHVQDDGSRKTSRLLSPRPLGPAAGYHAVLVAAFDANGSAAWDSAHQPATLPVLYAWRFWTGEAGDFETLATALTPRQASGLGRAPLAYRRANVAASLKVSGAITTLGADPDGPQENIARTDFAAFVAAVRALRDHLGRSVIGLPNYGRPWVADPSAASWTSTLNTDPRLRGTAGLGLWMGIEAQDELVDAAARQLGGLDTAAHLVRQLALGINVASALWRNRLPDNPTQRVDLFGPLMRRLRTPTGTALGAVTAAGTPLEPALFSSAAKRKIRRGTAWTRYSATGFVSRRALIDAANTCPTRMPQPLRLPHVNKIANGLGLPTLERLPNAVVHDPPPLDPDIPFDVVDFRRALMPLLPRGKLTPCHPVDLTGASGAVSTAIDPRGPNPPVLLRIKSRIKGLTLNTLEPPEIPVGLDFPTWTLLRDKAKEWILPGISGLPKDSIVAMQTNPSFIDAYLVGINTQLLGEMHWRNMAVDRRATPLLMFWGNVNFATGVRQADIQPLSSWSATSALGDLAHQVIQPGDTTGKRDLVIVFRTDLFRRYPRTVVYLAKPTPTADDALRATPEFSYTAATKANRRFLGPIFQGALGPDVVFFSFDVDPATLGQYWLVLDEPPSELRFRAVDGGGNPLGGNAQNAAAFAAATIDKPTRVGIDGAFLASLGLHL